jgi:lipoprotein-anchoring transpeptidase ErfK/SrfK
MRIRSCAFAALLVLSSFSTQVSAGPLDLLSFTNVPLTAVVVPKKEPRVIVPQTALETLRRGVPGTIVIKTSERRLYYIHSDGTMEVFPVGVGRLGFQWRGVHEVERKQEWPAWYPPAQMLKRQPYLPRMMAGGPRNPLGARALYIGGTLYRIHGTNDPGSVGRAESSGCFRMKNEDVMKLYDEVAVGTTVVVE